MDVETVIRLVALLIPLLLVAFWAWMFYAMLTDGELPANGHLEFRWPPQTKHEWTLFFILLSVITAAYYYFTEYKNRRQF